MLYDAIPWFLVLAAPVAIVTLVIARRRHRDLSARERHWRLLLDVALALCLFGIACVTLLPTVGGGTGLEQGLQLVPFTSIIHQLTSALDTSVAFRTVGLNIVLFIPLGFLLRVCPLGLFSTVALVAATSLTIETLQAVLPLGRIANIDDVLLNTLGGILGAAIGGLLLRQREQPQSAEALQRPDA